MSLLIPERPVYLIGPSSWLPARAVDNEELLKWMGSKARASWIAHRTGVKSRRWAATSEACSDLALRAAEALLKLHPGARAQVRQIILATVSGDYPSPPTAPRLQARLGLVDAGAFDVGAACAGFSTGLHVSAALCSASRETILMIASEIRSKFLDPADFATGALFGDGAAAALISAQPSASGICFKVLGSRLFSDGSLSDVIRIDTGGSRTPYAPGSSSLAETTLRMKDPATLFLRAAEGMSSGALRMLQDLGTRVAEIDWLVPHQANGHLVAEVATRLGIPTEKVIQTIEWTGNASGASVGIALAELAASKPLAPGHRVLLVAAGGGGIAACSLLQAVGPAA